jgi:hypothetical protein
MTMSWIPKKIAFLGNSVKIGKNSWTISETYVTLEESEFAKKQRQEEEFQRLYFD